MKRPLFFCLLLAAGVVCAAARAPLMVNEDAWYFIGNRPAEEMTVEGLKAHIDRYAAGGKVTQAFANNGLCKQSRSGGAVTGNIIGLC